MQQAQNVLRPRRPAGKKSALVGLSRPMARIRTFARLSLSPSLASSVDFREREAVTTCARARLTYSFAFAVTDLFIYLAICIIRFYRVNGCYMNGSMLLQTAGVYVVNGKIYAKQSFSCGIVIVLF